jgi:hypothetical protein
MSNEGFERSFFDAHVGFVIDNVGFTIIREKFQANIWVLESVG